MELVQTYQCRESVVHNDVLSELITELAVFSSRFKSLIVDENFSSKFDGLKSKRGWELEQLHNCDTCIHRVKYRLSGKCDAMYLQDNSKTIDTA